MFRWLANRRRQRIRETPFPEPWFEYLDRNVPYYHQLSEDDRNELLDNTKVLLDEKHFEGCDGFEITDEVRVTIAAHASCLILHRDARYFPRLRTVLVYPSLFMVPTNDLDVEGVISADNAAHAGLSWDIGVIVLAWDEVLRSTGTRTDGYNVILHEFAHQLDLEDWVANGTPLLGDSDEYHRWSEIFQADYEAHVEQVRRNRRTVIDEYGATDEAEFFAVATEHFFETPRQLQRRHADLYQLLSAYYGQDPANLG